VVTTFWQRGDCVEFYSWMLCVTAFSTSIMSWNPDRWSGVRPAPASVLVVLEVLRVVVRMCGAFSCGVLCGGYTANMLTVGLK